MKKVTNKILAILLVLALAGVQFITTGVYAAELLEQNSETSEENVKFNATIGDDNSHDKYSYTANIDSDANKLYLSINVENTGYLKDIVITLQDNNYVFSSKEVEDQRIKSISDNKIELNQINAGENVNLAIPITLNKQDSISKDAFNKESKVILNAVYVNAKNKEKKIEKELKQNLSWTVDQNIVGIETSQNVIRYLNYNNQTMLSFILSDKIKDSKLPIDTKEMQVSVPELSGKKPSKIIINAISTANTNGKLDGVDFSQDSWSYDEKMGIITIKLNNEADENGNISWNKSDADKFVITYLYDVNMNNMKTTVSSKVSTNVSLINGMKVNNETQTNDFNIDGKIGDIVNAEITSNVDSLNKGYMYNNINNSDAKNETVFSETYKINVGLAEALDKVTVKEIGEFFNEEDASSSIYDKRVSISKDELVKILGENGNINILNANGEVLGTLNKDTLSLDVNASKLSFEISKPITEGEISIHVDKGIKGDINYSKEQIQNFKTLTSKILINQEASKTINLEEPSSKASIEISNKNLSTVVKNENVVLTATLETDDITDALYQNPEITIKLPDEVKNMELKDATLLYEDQLVQNKFTVDGNTIYLSLNGLQTKYATQSISKGTVVRLVLDLTLDNLAPSRDTNITLNYVNNNETVQNSEEKARTVEAPVSVVAPTGFVTTNTLSGYNGEETVVSQEGKESTGKMQVYSDAKTMTVSGTVVNNLGSDAEGLKVLGRIPFKGNKEIGSTEDLGTTFDTKFAEGLTVEGIEGSIYYSENGEADTNLDNSANGWTTEYTENAKSYMIVANNTVTNTTRFNFSYKVSIPENLSYGSIAKENYGIYYNNNSEAGATQNLVLATRVGITTGEVPTIQEEITVKDLFTGETIENSGDVEEGQYLEYTFKIKNTGKETANNVKAKITIPDTYAKVDFEDSGDPLYPPAFVEDTVNKEFEETIESIAPGEERTITINTKVTGKVFILEGNTKAVVRISVSADKMENTSENVFETNIVEGYISATLGSNYQDKVLAENQNIYYYLDVKNVNNVVKNNVIVKIKMPTGIRYVSSLEIDETIGEYNEETRELTINLGTLEANDTRYITINAVSESVGNGTLETKAIITCNETDKEISSNIVRFYNDKYNVSASITSNIQEGNLLDTDALEYYIDIKNEGISSAIVRILDNIPTELNCESYKIEVTNGEGSKDVQYSSNQFSEIVTLNAGGSARVTIKTRPKVFTEGETKEITNTPDIDIVEQENGQLVQEVEINGVTHIIEGTGGTDSPGGNGTYRISGVIWVDENNDGRKDTTEEKLSGIRVTLFDQTTGNIVKDVNGNDMYVVTDENGRYTFSNLSNGNYLVVVEYDTANYELTTYNAEGILESENSDFVDARLYDRKVAATNTITVNGKNMYNIDLGLKKAEQFDLSLAKTVSKVTVTNTKLDPQVHEYNQSTALVSLLNTYVEYSTVLIEYNITVTNEGAIPGYAKEIVDYLPEGMSFSSDLNNSWYLGSDGNAYTTSLANTLLQPGESKTVTLVLSRKMTGENTGTVRNIAEINSAYNEYGKEDVDSTPGNNKDGEDDKTYADTIITMGTGREVASFIGITIGVLAIIATAVFLIKKYIIGKI